MTVFKKTYLAFLIIMGIAFNPIPAYADEEVRDLAIGVGIGLLAKGFEALSKPKEELVNEVNATQTLSAKPKIEYSEEVTEVQSNLKELGYYHGSVDGLKGQQTTKAINQWRQDNDFEITDKEMDSIERDILNDRADTSRENRQFEKRRTEKSTKPSPSKNEKPLYDAYYGYFGAQTLYKVCKEFKDSNHELSHMVDDTIDRNYQDIEGRLLEEVQKAKECSNISDEKDIVIKEQAYDGFIKSTSGQMMDLALKAGPHLYVDQSDAYSRVEGCNSYSRKLMLMYNNLKNKPVICETVK